MKKTIATLLIAGFITIIASCGGSKPTTINTPTPSNIGVNDSISTDSVSNKIDRNSPDTSRPH